MRLVRIIKFNSTERDENVTNCINNELMRIYNDGGKIGNIIYRDTRVNDHVKYCCIIEYEK